MDFIYSIVGFFVIFALVGWPRLVWDDDPARLMIGATNPLESAPGTIRGDLAVEVGRNVIHGSDSVESAEREIALWFGGDDELLDYEMCIKPWVREE